MERRRFLTFLAGAAASRAAHGQAAEPLYMMMYDHGGVINFGTEHFTKYLRSAVEWLDRYPSFKIGIENEAYAYDYMAEQTPELLKELRGYLAKYRGRLGVGTSTYGQPLSCFVNEESNIRHFEYGLAATRRHLGTAPDIYLMSEHAMHAQIPQILAGLGFKAALMRTHFMMYGYNPTFDVGFGWWLGIDGSRIPTVPTYRGAGAEFGKTTEDNWVLTRYPKIVKESPADFKAKYSRIKPLLASLDDDSKHREEELVREYEGKPGFRWILLEDMLASFPQPAGEMKTLPNDFVVRMPWGYFGNEIWNTSRRAEVAILTAERLAAIGVLLGGTNREEELQRAWKSLLVAQHHDVQITGGSLKIGRKFLGTTLETSDQITQASMQYVASRMQGGSAGQVTVFNPLSWPRKEWIREFIEHEPPSGRTQAPSVRRGGKEVPYALVPSFGAPTSLAILADVPGLGFTSYSLGAAEKTPAASVSGIEIDQDNLVVANQHWRIRFHPDGGLAGLEDRHISQVFLKAPGVAGYPAGRGAFLAGRIEGADCESQGKWKLIPGPAGAPWVTARERGLIGGIPYTLELTMFAESRRLDFRLSCHFENERIGVLSENRRDAKSGFTHEAKLRFKLFPAVGEGAVGMRDVPFAVTETGDPYVQGVYWTALSDGRVGLAVFNRGTMCSVRETDGGFSVPLAWAMHYIWGGARMLAGDYSYEFALYPFAGPWGEADLHRYALEYNFPLVAVRTGPGDGRLGDELKLLDAGSANVVVSALYPAGRHTYARLYEYRGRTDNMAIRYLRGRARLTEVDLAGNEKGPISSSLSFRPWQIRTVRIDAASMPQDSAQ